MNQPANKMATRPVFPLLMSMALPPMFSMLLSSLYNIVDSMFVARYSADALTAVSLAFPLQNFALAVSVGAGVGISSYIARKLGEGDTEAVNSAVSHGLLLSLIHYLLFVLIGFFAAGPFLSLFTDSQKIRALGEEYLFIVLVGCIGQQVQIAIEKMLQATGNMVWPMLMQALGFCIPTLFQAVGRGRSSLVIFLLRPFLITLPLAWLLAGPFGLTGIWLSFLAAESVAALAALVMLARLLRADLILHAENPAA